MNSKQYGVSSIPKSKVNNAYYLGDTDPINQFDTEKEAIECATKERDNNKSNDKIYIIIDYGNPPGENGKPILIIT